MLADFLMRSKETGRIYPARITTTEANGDRWQGRHWLAMIEIDTERGELVAMPGPTEESARKKVAVIVREGWEIVIGGEKI